MSPIRKRPEIEITRGRQDLRKVIHISIGMLGFLYPFLDWEIILFAWIAALFCVWFIPSRVEVLEVLLRSDERRLGYSPAMMSYAVVMIVASLIFRESMKDSSIILLAALAFGDGFSGLIGMNYAGTRIPYNEKKTINGTLAFILFGTIGALVMIYFHYSFTLHRPIALISSSFPIFRVLIVMFVCAIVETFRWRIPDNIPIGIAGIITLLATMKLYR